jgi:ABC-type antimicrobial peptide transport system permease subunit
VLIVLSIVLVILAVIPGTLIAVAALTAVPARSGARRSVAEVLRAEQTAERFGSFPHRV